MLKYNRMIATWNEFILEFPDAIDLAEFDLLKETAIIKKIGNEWCVTSEDGSRKFGCYSSRPAAEKRLKEIEMFRHMKSDKAGEAFARQECFCEICHAIFWVSTRCDLSICPVCGAGGDDIEELTGVL